MHNLFPSIELLIDKEKPMIRQSHQLVIPSTTRNYNFGLYKILPPGKPDFLRVEVIHTREGTERCTAAIYGGKAFVIHFGFEKHIFKPSK